MFKVAKVIFFMLPELIFYETERTFFREGMNTDQQKNPPVFTTGGFPRTEFFICCFKSAFVFILKIIFLNQSIRSGSKPHILQQGDFYRNELYSAFINIMGE
jgi:hypothetical protein